MILQRCQIKQSYFFLNQVFQITIVMKQSKGSIMRSIQDYTLLQKVGQGQYGYVYKAEHQTTKSLFAIKVMLLQKFKSVPKLTELTNNQTTILSKINHPNIIKFIQMFQTATHYYLVYQFCNGGTLEDKIKTQKMINQHDAATYFAQLISAFSVLFENRILHRDIKPTNILFHNGKLKLADFGFCKSTALNVMAKTMVGSPIYMAPQVLRGQQYDSRADIWSLGVVLYEMLYGHCPYEDNSIPKLISMISGKMLIFPKFPRVCDPLRVFMKRMLTMNSNERISPEQFTQYPIELVFNDRDEFPVLKMEIKGAIKFTRNNLLYLSETLTKLAPQVVELSYLRMAFLTYKIIMNVWRLTRKSSPYWQQIGLQNNVPVWEQYCKQQIQALRPYGQIVRESIRQCDVSLRLKLQLQKENIDTKYFIQSLSQIPQQSSQMREALINSLLINMHYMRVIDKKKPDWRDFTTIQKSYQEKQQYCLRYARYN